MNDAWRSFTRSISIEILPQTEMTWYRYGTVSGGGPAYSRAILDVIGASVGVHNGCRPLARGGGGFPAPSVSDHFQIELPWVPCRRRREVRPENSRVRRPLTASFSENEHFMSFLNKEMHHWWTICPNGLCALPEFVDNACKLAKQYIKSNVIPVISVEHKLSVEMLEHVLTWSNGNGIPAGTVSRDRINFLCMAYPRLEVLIVVALHGDDLVSSSVDHTTVIRIEELIGELHEEACRNREVAFVAEAETMHLQTSQTDDLLKRLKGMKVSTRLSVEQLWLEEKGRFSDDPADYAELSRGLP